VRDHLLLYLNGQPVRVTGEDAFLTLSDFLRRRRGLAGTKVVCAEGDCGSCSVMVGRPEAGQVRYAAVTSCIQLMFQLDAAHVVTVEGLRAGRELNPIQQAMVACHGTQCGFCTPGLVVALYDLMHDGRVVDAEGVRRGLVGNLCRCTGYDSIVRSALATDRASLRPVDALYPPETLTAELTRATGEEVLIEAGSRKFFKPTTIERAARFRADNPGCVVVAGGTDMGVVYNKRMRAIDVALSTASLADLRTIRVHAGSLHVGACATLAALERTALEHLPELGRFLAFFGSPLVKNAGTLGGNLVTGSPIGDTIPALMVLDAEVELTGVAGVRRVPINQFYAGYRRTVLTPGELVTRVRIPLPRPGETFKLYKVSRRKDLDISSFGAAIWLRRSGNVIEDVRIAYGGVGPTVLRMSKAEAVLRGQPATLERFEQAGDVARDEVTPITDVRGSEQYRRTLAANILVKFWHEALAGGHQRTDGNGDGRAPQPPAPPPPARVRTPRLAPGRKGRT
jgi:xanthine dehydrogenase small subunit